MKALNMTMAMMGADGWFVDELLPMAGAELEGAYLTTGVSTDSPEFAEFNAEFEKKHNVKPNIYAYYSLDALMLIEQGLKVAIEKAGKPDPTALKDALEQLKDAQLFTSKVTMEPDTHNPHNKPILIMQIVNSQWKIIKTFTPGQ
jgi:branched-chain amino acid transport system substrate-binding protein